jgi:integrase
MSHIVLTEAKCRTLKPGPRRRFVLDGLVPGLVLQVTPQGHRSFMLRGLFPGGRNRVRRLLGEVGAMTLDQARATGRDWLALLAQGRDPQQEQALLRRAAQCEAALTFAVVADAYIADRLRGKRQGERSAKEIRAELVSRWGGRPLATITRGDVIQLVDDLKARAQRNAGERATGAFSRIVFAHCRALFGWAALRYDLEHSPCDRLRPKDLGLVAKPRQRVLNDVEIRTAWAATAEMSYPFGALVRALLMTGCRRGEIAGGRWAEIDLATRTWTIPAQRAKADSPHIIPLTDDLLALLASLPRYQSGDFIFTTTFGRRPIAGFSKAATKLHRIMRAELGDDMASFSLHDLRRTMRTRLSELRVPEHVAEACIAHSRTGIARVYDLHRFADEIRSAIEQWHRRLGDIVSSPRANANVVALRA